MNRNKKNQILGIAILFLLSLSFTSTRRDDRDIERLRLEWLNQEIQAAGFQWTAGPTSVSEMDPNSRRMLLGGLMPMEWDMEPPQEYPLPSDIPATLDWRSHNGSNWMTSIRNQSTCGSCWAFGPLAAIESQLKINNNRPDWETDFSEQHLVSCSGAGDCANGGYASQALTYIKNQGTPTETCYPYVARDTACTPCSNWRNQSVRIVNWIYINQSTFNNNAVITALQKGPLTCYMEVFSDFYNYSSGVYQKTSSATSEGGHFIGLCGYNRTENYWICKNSWGTRWGENGYFRIATNNSSIALWTMQVNGSYVTGGNHPPVLDSIGAKSIKEGETLTFSISATDVDNDTLTYSCSSLPTGATFSGQTFTWQPTYTQSGSYAVTFNVRDNIVSDSETVVITVANVKRGFGQ